MPPSALVISKLGIKCATSDTHVKGLLCLKISLPKDYPGSTGARWALFNSSPPNLVSQPTLHALPLAYSNSPNLRTAISLLSLPTSSDLPSPASLATRPYIDVSSTTAKVYVVTDAIGNRRRSGFKGKLENTERSEWLVCMEFKQTLDRDADEEIYKVLLPLPRCLDNVIRFQIVPPSTSTSIVNEVSILTEPKMLPLPPSTSQSNLYSTSQKDSETFAAEWEVEDVFGNGDEVGDEGSSWLEGRFQSTDILRLEWSFTSTMVDSSSSSLVITPTWSKSPSLQMYFASSAPGFDTVVPVEVNVPEGWAWSELLIEGNGLAYWRGVNEDWDEEDPDRTINEEHDDSFISVPGKSSRQSLFGPHGSSYLPSIAGSSSANLMRQTLPTTENIDDFSFEMSSDQLMARPHTPLGSKSTHVSKATNLSASKQLVAPTSYPLRHGRMFDLYFNDSGDRNFTLQGVLVPASPLTLVSQLLPFPIPLVSFPTNGGPQECIIQCPNALYSGDSTTTSEPKLVSISSGASFSWVEQGSHLIKRSSQSIKGDVKVRLKRDVWGIISMSILFPYPQHLDEVGFSLFSTDTNVRIVRASIDGLAAPRFLYSLGDQMDIRIGRREDRGGLAEVVLEISGRVIGMPVFEGTGDGFIELCGDNWDVARASFQTKGLTRTSPTTYYYTLSNPTSIIFSIPITSPVTASPTRTLFSFSTLFNLFLLWLLLSMGSQMQRLRQEVAFVADEARDLRYHGYQPSREQMDTQNYLERAVLQEASASNHFAPGAPKPQIAKDAFGLPTSLTNQVPRLANALAVRPYPFEGWEWVSNHPTVSSLKRGAVWVWRTVIWLLLPTVH
ncbi:uncharacterized protein L203_101299 [Cryptococcus depauperatus CBS 7841]|uniref:Uncharacterized protein n=1 Tax=Cryptococcus depauperatus CBS 7841 TaxID=1295531 RepID=A0A1E3ICR6_9TREE|nr:hypothetical protein L203_04343 [Cryptococcus depauperatus CBS 7841]